MTELSAFMPVFNEAPTIEFTVREALAALDSLAVSSELIVVDDGSTDGTRGILERLATEASRLRVVRHASNRGYGMALRSGIAASIGRLVFYTDGDGQFDWADLPRAHAIANEDRVVVGRRAIRRDHSGRRFQSRIFNALMRLAFDLPVDDINCSFKIFPGDAVRTLDLRSDGVFIDAEMLVGLRRAGCTFTQIDVTHRARPAGTSKLAGIRHVWQVVREARAFRMMTPPPTRPRS
ncbi:MAG: glycosyltransferase family 2 protein [Deltaproteobacteria bacterium]|nr:glycosyltransferase family 2 protein [Deltaproteobacteria bacterium]